MHFEVVDHSADAWDLAGVIPGERARSRIIGGAAESDDAAAGGHLNVLTGKGVFGLQLFLYGGSELGVGGSCG
jgi:hypothetical protein